MKNKFLIKTLGCKTNQIESAIIEEKLLSAGFEQCEDLLMCNYFILNSCSVTDSADNKSLSVLKSAKNKNPNIKTIVTGCFAQLQSEFLKKYSFIDIILGNHEKLDIVEFIQNAEKVCVSDIFSYDKFRYEKLNDLKRTRATVKIQDGCNNKCAYCTIPLARGKSRSNAVGNVVEQINILADNGYQEVVLTGIHIGQWGNDFSDCENLVDLLENIEKTSIQRYRIGSLNPLELDDNLVNFLSNSEKFCPHLHLSLQSVCDKTLKTMNRSYKVEEIKSLTSKLNQKFNLPFVGCDIIAGFPGESDEDFEVSYNNLKNLDLSQIHVFPYSKRQNTLAAEMPNQVSDKTKKERTLAIQSLSEMKFEAFLQKNINTKNEVIIEKNIDKKSGLLKGLTGNYLTVLLDGSLEKYKSKLVKVEISEYSQKYKMLMGKIIND